MLPWIQVILETPDFQAHSGTEPPHFANEAEVECARILDFHGIAWEYEPHSFVLEQVSGGKFEKQLTTVPFTGTKTVTVTLKKGKWKYYCAPHESSMFGFFTVT